MADPILKFEPEQSKDSENVTLEGVISTFAKELVIAICGPVGSAIHYVAERLEQQLNDVYDYDASTIKLSDFIKKHRRNKKTPLPEDKYEKTCLLIQEGDHLRGMHGASILAELAIGEICIKRNTASEGGSGKEHLQPKRFCHIIDSIKNDSELNLLRAVYSNLLVTVGVFSHKDERVKNLRASGMPDEKIYELIDLDSGEELKSGQSVKDTFPKCDFFLNCEGENTNIIDDKIERLLNIVTGSKITTPTAGERSMYHAYCAGLSSACLSRQVGAAVTDADGNLLSVGWNDVPRYDGGLYTAEHDPDNRCMNLEGGKCFNDTEKRNLVKEIVQALGDIIPAPQKAEAEKVLGKSRVKQLLEFSRSVHAEMYAILNAGAEHYGGKIQGGQIYVTTYPCHNCARHIIAAGIHEVFYIEPYPKSLALHLHGDAITEDVNCQTKVRIVPFEGVGPAMFERFFKYPESGRKNKDGKMISIPSRDATFTSNFSIWSLPQLESKIVTDLKEKSLISATDE